LNISKILLIVRHHDAVARVGVDDFDALLPNVNDVEGDVKASNKIRIELEKPFVAPSGNTLVISASVRIPAYPDHADNKRDLLRSGDTAMYCAKRAGRKAWPFRMSKPVARGLGPYMMREVRKFQTKFRHADASAS
jgi:diguanylate cyclase (GGDEF)-like protein